MELTRAPYSDPLTLRERLAVKRDLATYDARKFIHTGFWQWLAHRLPRRLVYFAYIRVMAHAWAEVGNKHPDEIGYQEACERWMGTDL